MQRSTILFVGGCIGILIGLGLMLVGGSLYRTERHKELAFIKDSCLVASGSYAGDLECRSSGRIVKIRKCYQPIWQVLLPSNKTERYTIKGDVFPGYQNVLEAINKYQVGRTYPCWYGKPNPSNLSFYQPKSTPGLILLISGGTIALISIVCVVISIYTRSKADL